MSDNMDKVRNSSQPSFTPEENETQPKKPSSVRLKPRVCFIITKKKNSSWVDDICNHEMLAPNYRVYH